MYKKLLAFSFLAASILFSGCGSSDTGKTSLGKSETNILGIIKYEEDAYTRSGINTFDISTDEITARANYSGEKTTLLWGLITLKDY